MAQRSIREITFSGSHRERGRRRGRRLQRTLTIPVALPSDPDFVRGCYEAAKAAHPPATEEFEGLVEGGDFPRRRMMAYYFARIESALGGTPGCTMFALSAGRRAGDRGALAARNYDWATEDLRWCELHRYEGPGLPRRVGYTHHWAGCTDVLSETGLYVAIASLPPSPVHAPGVQWNIIVEMLTETCSSVEEAAEACAAVRHLRPMSYLLADPQGAVGIVEATPTEVRFRGPTDGLVAAANVCCGGELLAGHDDARAEGSLPSPLHPQARNYREDATERARRRVNRVRERLGGTEPVEDEAVETLLADHRAPICCGDHDNADGAPWATIWSGICEPSPSIMRIAPGLPCRHDFQPFTL